ncbi:hypothetical protein AWENTII_002776 [Aspergillus wentii]
MRLFYLFFLPFGIAQQALTSNGEITGHYASKSPAVLEWLGIPYAQPPVGKLRFAPPVELNRTNSSVADKYGCDCLYPSYGQVAYPNKTAQFDRIFDEFSYVNNNTQSEDCLTLNIWAKPSSALKPVYVHFYGGRWTRGSSNTTFYYGGYFADAQDIIVVTVNYRFNIFGFPGIPNHPPNPGLLDQRLAVEWVKRNIRSFGGDPDRIVVSGQSVGGTSVDYWAYAYADDPIVKGLISHSGTALSFPISSPEEAARHWYDASEILGCGRGSEEDVLSCMKRQNATDIINAAAKVKVAGDNPARKAPAFQPTIDNVTVFANYTQLSSQGKFARIPYLVGHTSNEAGFYKVTTYAAGVTLPRRSGNHSTRTPSTVHPTSKPRTARTFTSPCGDSSTTPTGRIRGSIREVERIMV